MPILFRFQSMILYSRLCPPPRWRVVMRPLLLRPAVFFSGSVRARSGDFLVISSKVDTDIPRRPGDVGLYVLTGISHLRHLQRDRGVDRRAASRRPSSTSASCPPIGRGGALCLLRAGCSPPRPAPSCWRRLLRRRA